MSRPLKRARVNPSSPPPTDSITPSSPPQTDSVMGLDGLLRVDNNLLGVHDNGSSEGLFERRFILNQLEPEGGWPDAVQHDDDIGANQLGFIQSVAEVKRATYRYLGKTMGMAAFVCAMHLWVLKHYIAKSGKSARGWITDRVLCKLTNDDAYCTTVVCEDIDLTCLHASKQLMEWYRDGHPLIPTKHVLRALLDRVHNFCAGVRLFQHVGPWTLEGVDMHCFYDQFYSLHDLDVFIQNYRAGPDVAWSARYFFETSRYRPYPLGFMYKRRVRAGCAMRDPFDIHCLNIGLELICKVFGQFTTNKPLHVGMGLEHDDSWTGTITVNNDVVFNINGDALEVIQELLKRINGCPEVNTWLNTAYDPTVSRYVGSAVSFFAVGYKYVTAPRGGPNPLIPHHCTPIDAYSFKKWAEDLPDFTNAHKAAFLLAFQERAGRHSDAQRSLRKQSHFDSNVARLIFSLVDPKCTNFKHT